MAKNVENLGGASINRERITGKARRSTLEGEKAKGFNMQVC